MYDNRKIHPIHLGDRLTVQTIRGIKGNIIGQLPDGRAMLFDRDSPYMNMLGPNQLVECNVIHVSQRYVIVDPIREPEPFKRVRSYSGEPKPIEMLKNQDVYDEPLLEDLRILSEKGEWENGIIAGALLYIIERFDDFKEKLSKRSSLNTGSLVEEQTVEASTVSDEFLRASSSFGLTQNEVRESKEPESEFLRYLEEEEGKDNDTLSEEGIEDDDLLSTKLEDFGVIVDIPKDMTLLTMGQTRYLKEQHLKNLDGYDKIETFSTFFVEASALKRREYGNVFYASKGTNPWNKVHKITVQRIQG